MPSQPKYKRVLLKLSGEALQGEGASGFDIETIGRIATEIKTVHDMGVEVCVVVGAGNIVRGTTMASLGLDRVDGDYMGMLATVINAMALRNVLETQGTEANVLSAIPAPACENYNRARAIHYLETGRIVVFGGGTGNPLFTTDTAAALRASETRCCALLKGTQVDGVYSADPKRDPNAKRYDSLSFNDVLSRELKVMDGAAIAIARDNKVPILVFSIHNPGSFADVVMGKGTFTTVG